MTGTAETLEQASFVEQLEALEQASCQVCLNDAEPKSALAVTQLVWVFLTGYTKISILI
jgi:hypothetical protein